MTTECKRYMVHIHQVFILHLNGADNSSNDVNWNIIHFWALCECKSTTCRGFKPFFSNLSLSLSVCYLMEKIIEIAFEKKINYLVLIPVKEENTFLNTLAVVVVVTAAAAETKQLTIRTVCLDIWPLRCKLRK